MPSQPNSGYYTPPIDDADAWEDPIDAAHRRESESRCPAPPPSMFERRRRWEYDRSLEGEPSPLRGALGNAERTWARLPRWTRTRSSVERLDVMAAEIRDAALGWNRQRRNVLFAGPTGRGKTTALAHVWLEMWELAFARKLRPLETLWTKATDLANARRGHPLGEGDPKIIIEAKRVALLLLDDLGAEMRNDTTLWEVLDARYDAGLLTITTSGLPLPNIIERYGEAAVRRLMEGERPGQIIDVFPRAEQIRRVK